MKISQKVRTEENKCREQGLLPTPKNAQGIGGRSEHDKLRSTSGSKRGAEAAPSSPNSTDTPRLCPRGPHQEPAAAPDVPQRQGNVQEHDGIADHHGDEVTVALTVQFIFDTSLSGEGNGEIGVLVVFQKVNKPKKYKEFDIMS